MSREEAESRVEELGDALLVGQQETDSLSRERTRLEYEKARQLGVTILSEKEFLEMAKNS